MGFFQNLQMRGYEADGAGSRRNFAMRGGKGAAMRYSIDESEKRVGKPI
jgi:hypothetical protein